MGTKPSRIMARQAFGTACVLMLATGALAGRAEAGFEVCNKSNERASVSIGYKDDGFGWTSEGWWPVAPGECVDIIKGDLKSRYYYIYATGHRGGVWQGAKGQEGGFFCVRQAKYTLINRDYETNKVINCEKAKLKTEKFISVDTGEAKDFTFNLRN
jgi:uncharacterized membrane protein